MTTRQAKRLREGDQVKHADGINGSVVDVLKSIGVFEVRWDDGIVEYLPFDSAESITLVRGD